MGWPFQVLGQIFCKVKQVKFADSNNVFDCVSFCSFDRLLLVDKYISLAPLLSSGLI